MSLYCEIRKQPRVVNGELVNPGECAMIPNSLALALEDKGLVAWASPEAHAKMAAERHERREAAKLDTKKGKR
jgi:hypothetical protein